MGERALTRPFLLISARFDGAAGVKQAAYRNANVKGRANRVREKSCVNTEGFLRVSDGKVRWEAGC